MAIYYATMGFMPAALLTLLMVGQGAGQKSVPKGEPAVNPEAATIAEFQKRLKDYAALHQKIKSSLPKLPSEATPQQIDSYQRDLARLITAARTGAKPGNTFTPDMQAFVKRLFARVFAGREGATLKASIMDENPMAMKIAVNGRYPDTVPLSTMPPQVLKELPPLPDELEYRFIGTRLVLMDVHAHIIVDYMDNALLGQ